MKGNILLETGKPDQARAEFERALKLVEGSSLSPEVKANAGLVSHYNLARVAAAKKDFKTARSEADVYRKGAEAKKNPAQVRSAHELDGIIALAEKDYDRAIPELPCRRTSRIPRTSIVSAWLQGEGRRPGKTKEVLRQGRELQLRSPRSIRSSFGR